MIYHFLYFLTSHFCMSQGGCPKPNPAHGRWWVGSASRSQHDMGRSSLGFWSWWSRREPRAVSTTNVRHNRAYGGYARSQRERAITTRSNLLAARRGMWCVPPAIQIVTAMPRSLWKLRKPTSHAHRSTGADRVSERTVRPPALKTKRQPMPVMLVS